MQTKNQVLLIGLVDSDPKVGEFTGKGGKTGVRASFDLITGNIDEFFKDTSKKFLIEKHKIVAWDDMARWVGESVRRGSGLNIEGSIRTRYWKDTEGNGRWITEITAGSITQTSHQIPVKEKESDAISMDGNPGNKDIVDNVPF